MASVWMVHSENGMYSDIAYSVEGVFSSREKAVAYIMLSTITAYHHVGEAVREDGWSKRVDVWNTSSGGYLDTEFAAGWTTAT